MPFITGLRRHLLLFHLGKCCVFYPASLPCLSCIQGWGLKLLPALAWKTHLYAKGCCLQQHACCLPSPFRVSPPSSSPSSCLLLKWETSEMLKERQEQTSSQQVIHVPLVLPPYAMRNVFNPFNQQWYITKITLGITKGKNLSTSDSKFS